MKILIIKLSSASELILTTPLARCLKHQLSDLSLELATQEKFQDLVSENPYYDHVYYKKGESTLSFLSSLRSGNYDVVINLDSQFSTQFIVKFGFKAVVSIQHNSFQKWLFSKVGGMKLPVRHLVDRYFDAVAFLNVYPDQSGIEFFIKDQDKVPLDWLTEPFRKEFVVVAIGSAKATRRLPTNRLIELCDKINKPVVLIGGQDVAKQGDEVALFFEKTLQSAPYEDQLQRELGKKSIVFNGCGKFTIGQSASLVKQAKVVFSTDYYMMHIAAAYRKKVYSIWGSSVPAFGRYPYGTSFVIFENNKLSCRPCAVKGKDQCPKGHFKCMQDVVFDFYIP